MVKFDVVKFKIDNYLTKGSLELSKIDFTINIHRSTRAQYIGMSAITGCGRLLWVQYYYPNLIQYASNIEQDYKSARIFDYGHIVEDVTIKCLELGGAVVTDTQTKFSDHGDKFRGHCDCVIDHTLIGEIKSMNNDNFIYFRESGIKVSHYAYYVQTNLYMKYSNLSDGVLIATNKNTAEMTCEHLEYDAETAEYNVEKAKSILDSPSYLEVDHKYLPKDKSYCTFCPLRKTCYNE